MSDQAISTDPVAAILTAKGTPPRALGLIVGIAGIMLPAFSSSGFGLSETTNLLQINGLAAGFPLILVLVLVTPGIAAIRPYARLIDLVGLLAGLGLLIHAAFVFFDAQRQIGQTIGNLMPNSVTLSPAYGLALVVLAIAMVGFQAIRPGRG